MRNRDQKHTPGPWVVHPRIKGCVTTAKGGSIADLAGVKSEEQLGADARLIAAAPELLTVLGHLLHACENYCALDTETKAILADAKLVIARARGEL